MFIENGVEVQVTRASRDSGVDAIAFDPNPLTGGKFVIQAKRYTRTVDVSAVRDLFGMLQNEGANRRPSDDQQIWAGLLRLCLR